MNNLANIALGAILLTAGLTAAAQSPDAPDGAQGPGPRSEISLGISSWPDAASVAPLAAGSFDRTGFVLGGAVHWPLPNFDARGLMLGIDFVLFPHESDIAFRREDLVLRGGYLTPSLRWYPRSQQRFSVDVGAGLYIADIAEVRSGYGFYTETELWEATTAGGYVGGTWNFGAAGNDGPFVSLKVHFADFGTVRDEDPLLPATLGNDAGRLSGGLFQLQFGYRWQ